jgi:hypothetical protein
MDAMEARFPGSQDAVIMDKIDRMLSSKTASNSLLRALTLIWRSDDPLEDIKASLNEDFALFGDTALITIPSSKWIICIRLPHQVTAIAKSLFEEVDSFDLDHVEYEVLPSGVLPSILFMADTESALEWMRRTLTYTQDPGEGAKDILARVEAGEDIFD